MLLMPSYRPRVVASDNDAIEFVMPAAASTLTDYVGYIDFADTTIQASSGFLSKLISGSGNIRIFASDKTTEWCRHVNVVSANTSGQVWFKVPSYVSTGTTTFYMWADTAKVADYGVTDTFGRNNTFSPFSMFLGMDADPSGGTLTDWTGNGNDWTIQNMEAGDKVLMANGMYAYDFDGVDERAFLDTPSFVADTSGTLKVWFVPGSNLSSDGFIAIVGLGGTSNTANFGTLVVGQRDNTSLGDGSTDYIDITTRIEGTGTVNGTGGATTALVASSEHMLTAISNGTGYSFYVDGVPQTVDTWIGSDTGDWLGDIAPAGTDRLTFGGRFADGSWLAHYAYKVGPMNYRSSVISADMDSAEHSNQSDPATFYNSITEVTL